MERHSMEQEAAWREFSELPPNDQKRVIELIARLRARCRQSRPAKQTEPTDLAKEPFVGMWQDRDDLRDSSAWVRRVRENEWRVQDG